MAIGKALEELERPAAEKRKQEAIRERDEQGRAKSTSGNFPEVAAGDTRDKVAEAIGMSGRTYEKAKAVVAVGKG